MTQTIDVALHDDGDNPLWIRVTTEDGTPGLVEPGLPFPDDPVMRLVTALALLFLAPQWASAGTVMFDGSWQDQSFLFHSANDYVQEGTRLRIRSDDSVSVLWRPRPARPAPGPPGELVLGGGRGCGAHGSHAEGR